MSLPVTVAEVSFYQALSEHLAARLPAAEVMDSVEACLRKVPNPATCERLRDHMAMLTGADQEWHAPAKRRSA